ncbi:helix-turn-helix domain-containing protein [Frigidibacter sp. ROC022]|uniref:helix-turn-helix domain-containing protein n=1 Tax=Frigidibacter sp. ROC022 TaxID=2971796 RepID=UPI00215A4634|nr:helix-turn-helix transcriptional regulator [Frigidibacter sp. ROC022]MCR8723233.1 short-chain fatty acyl-CoA regulator family protein [Frigidibacter sp. ROC022]
MADRRGMGGRIRARRADLGVTQAALAAEVGISAPYLNLIEHERRRIGGRLLVALARALKVEPSALTEGAEAGLVAELGAALNGTSLDAGAERGGRVDIELEAARAADFAARFPGWAELVATQHRRIRSLEQAIEALSDRLTHDPRLAAALHEVLSTVTAIRSTASILAETGDLDRDWLDRFHRNLNEDGARLAASAQALVAYLDGEGAGPEGAAAAGAASPQEAFEAWLEARGGFLAEAEPGAESLPDPQLPDEGEARVLAESHLAQARRDALAMPLADMLSLVEAGAEPGEMARRFGVSLVAVFRRLVGLPGNPGGYGLVICDAAGAITFRRPPEGFQMPRLGAACPLWPLFQALSRPMQPWSGVIEQASRLPHRFRAWTLAEPAAAGAGDPGAAPVFVAAMLLRPARGDETAAAAPVGTTCRVCPRPTCAARREASVLPG